MPAVPKSERLALFLARLSAAPAAVDHDSGLKLLTEILNAVEDEYIGRPFNPANFQTDGRMYPPQSDKAHRPEGLPGVTIYRNRRHRTYFGDNGAIAIRDLESNAILLDKPGADGAMIWTKPTTPKKKPS